jgi:hypothetical protein
VPAGYDLMFCEEKTGYCLWVPDVEICNTTFSHFAI